MITMIIMASALIIPSAGQANVIFVGGDVSGVWDADSVIVGDSIFVSPGNSLEIEPGTDVIFLAAFSFRIYQDAVLRAIGTESDMISFRPALQGYSSLGIDFEGASDESIMEYCHITHALYSAIALTDCNITIRNCLLEDNPGYYRGGGISALEGSDALIENNIIRNNTTNQSGGGIYCNASSPTIRGNLIDGNSSGPIAQGGGISCSNHSHPLIVNNTFTNNEVTPSPVFPATQGQGAAIYCSNISEPTIIGNLFLNNRVNNGGESGQYGGGAIFVFSAAPIIENNVFAGNVTEYGSGGALYLFIFTGSLVNNVFYNNSALNYGGAVYMDLSDPTVTNSIFYNNSAGTGSEFYLDRSSTVNVSYSDIEGGWEGDGNIDADPMFRDPAGNDYHLMAIECGDPYDSPCIDAGNPVINDSLLDCSWGLGTVISDLGAYGGADSAAVDIYTPQAAVPGRYSLAQNYPNPFNAATTIKYELPNQAHVTLEILDVLGRKVKTITDGLQQSGYHQVIWNAGDVSSGVYFYKIQAGEYSESRKMILIK